MFSGFINLNKPINESSNKALFSVKKVLRMRGIETKVGHLGTLDPLACGVLPVALGRATRLFDFCLNKTKKYTAAFTFGITSESLDLGTETIRVDGEKVTKETLLSVLPDFVGKMQQIPPVYSAKSIGGVRAYKLARQGKSVTLPAKEIVIYAINLIDQSDENTFVFSIECSSGTYIRSIARDLGDAVGSAAVMTYLRRDKSGEFDLENSVESEQLSAFPDKLEEYVIPMEHVLKSLPSKVLTNEETVLMNGVRVPVETEGLRKVYLPDGTLVGIGDSDSDGLLFLKTRLI